MPRFFSTIPNNRVLWMASAAGALAGLALAYRYHGAGARAASPGAEESPLAPTSGHWLGSTPFLPGNIPSHWPSAHRAAIQSYLTETHMNMQHGTMETLKKRALAHQHWSGAEHTILAQTRAALSSAASPEFQMSSHMAHNERRLLADRADHLRATDPEADKKLAAEFSRMTNERSQGTGPAYDTLTDMLIHGKRGPLSVDQSALGVESVIVGHHVLDKTPQYAKDNPRMQATRPMDPVSKKLSHPTTSPHGLDLSQDEGTAMREALGLPVMTGTSGSASDVVRSYNFTVEALKKLMPEQNFLSAHEHRGVA